MEQAEARITKFTAVADLLAEQVYDYDLEAVEHIAHLLFSEADVYGLIILNERGSVVLDKQTPQENFRDKGTELTFPLVRSSSSGTANLGLVKLTISQTTIVSVVASVLAWALFSFVLSLVLNNLILTHYVFQQVVSPLNQLSKAIDKTLLTGSPVKTNLDEKTHIGVFAVAFNSMQSRLQTTQSELSKSVTDLGRQTTIRKRAIGVLEDVVWRAGGQLTTFDESGATTELESKGHREGFPKLPQKFFLTREQFQQQVAVLNDLDPSRVRPLEHEDMAISKALYQIEIEMPSGQYFIAAAFEIKTGGSAYIVFDRSAHKDVEQRLLQSQKVEALGPLTSGISHEFKNYLAVLSGVLESALMSDELPKDVIEILETGLTACWSASATTTALLAYSRSAHNKLDYFDVSAMLERVLPILKAGLPDQISLSAEIAPDMVAYVNRGLLESSILNLVTNAKDAMQGQGNIRIILKKADGKALRKAALSSGDYLALEVIDDGSGIPPEVLSRVFDPFFTTKKEGKGSGIGLSLVLGAATSAGGALVHFDEIPTGTRFVILLPLAKREEKHSEASQTEKPRSLSGNRVLLIDDEVTLAAIFKKALSKRGFSVTTVHSMTEARDELKTAGRYDAIVTDIMTADGNGIDLYNDFINTYPILVVSGNNPEDVGADNLPEEHFLQKPFPVATLGERIEKIILG